MSGIIYGLEVARQRVKLGYAKDPDTLLARWEHWHLMAQPLSVLFAEPGDSTREVLDLFDTRKSLIPLTPRVIDYARFTGVCPEAEEVRLKVTGRSTRVPFYERAPLEPRHTTITAVLSGYPIC